MALRSFFYSFLLAIAALPGSAAAQDAELRVAVASNIAATMRLIAFRFEEISGHDVVIISGSTGKHYAQIRQGAPFDIFFSADDTHPRLLESDGIAISGSRFTYAIGKMVLWSPRQDLIDSAGAVLDRLGELRIAIANPRFAPYGKAAKEILEARKLWKEHAGRIVRGENINQAFHFVESGNVDMGFVAYSHIADSSRRDSGSFWIVPQDLYTPIIQQAVLLADNDIARQFMGYVKGDEARQVFNDAGYDTP